MRVGPLLHVKERGRGGDGQRLSLRSRSSRRLLSSDLLGEFLELIHGNDWVTDDNASHGRVAHHTQVLHGERSPDALSLPKRAEDTAHTRLVDDFFRSPNDQIRTRVRVHIHARLRNHYSPDSFDFGTNCDHQQVGALSDVLDTLTRDDKRIAIKNLDDF